MITTHVHAQQRIVDPVPCPACEGSGKVNSGALKCLTCRGTGKVESIRVCDRCHQFTDFCICAGHRHVSTMPRQTSGLRRRG